MPPFQRRQSGDSPALYAEELNAMLDVARAWRDGLIARTNAAPTAGAAESADDFFTPASVIGVHNTTGGTIPFLAVLTPSGPAVDPAAQPLAARRRPVHTASAPVTADDPVFIAYRSIANDTVGPAVVSGETVAWVNVSDTAHRFARPDPGNIFNLVSATSGPVRLMQSLSETGLQQLYVLLQGSSTDGAFPCTSFKWVAGLRRRDCLRVTVTGGDGDELTLFSSDRETWISVTTISVCDALFTATFSRGDHNGPILDLTVYEGSGSDSGSGADVVGTYRGLRLCGGCNYALFAFSRCDLCPNAPFVGPGCDNTVEVRVELGDCYTQVFDVELECCPNKLFPRILSIEDRSCVDDALLPYRSWGGVPGASTGVYSVDLVWDAEFTAVWWTPLAGAWRGTVPSAVEGGSPLSLVFGCNYHTESEEWYWELIDPTVPSVYTSIPVDECPDDPAEAFEILLEAIGNQGQGPGEDPEGAVEPCNIGGSYFRIVAWADSGCENEGRDCTIALFAGAAWYCARNTSGGPCLPVELLEEDRCDTSITICSGPYATQAEAIAACCVPVGAEDCAECPDGAPPAWTFTLAGGDGDFAGANGDWLALHLTSGCLWNASGETWSAAVTIASGTVTVTLTDGAAVLIYTAAVEGACCGPFVLALDSSTGTGTPPAAPTLTQVGTCCEGDGSGSGEDDAVACCPGKPLPTGGLAATGPNPCGLFQENTLVVFQTGPGQILATNVFVEGAPTMVLRCGAPASPGTWWSDIALFGEAAVVGTQVGAAVCGESSITVTFSYDFDPPCGTRVVTWTLTW